MFTVDVKTRELIRKTCKGRKHIKLTAGYFINGKKSIQVFDEFGETGYQDYVYEIGSITKTFNASLLSKYILEHRVSLDDSIKKYLESPESDRYYPPLRRLATHTAGYPARYPLTRLEYIKFFAGMVSGKTQGTNPLNIDLNRVKLFMQQGRLQDKDYKWNYSNFGFGLIGFALGVVSGKGYWAAMNDFLINELALQQTYLGTFSGKNLPGFNAKNIECGNWHWDKDNLIAPAGAISSTAEDLLSYAKINMYEEKPYLPLCHIKHANGPKNYDMGLGWWLRKGANHILMHGGGTGCFSSFLAFDKEKKAASVVLANYRLGINSDERIALSMLKDLQRR